MEQLTHQIDHIIQGTKANLPFVLGLIGILWGILIINRLLFKRRLLYLGILPRHLPSLPGIIFSPFLHADFDHLLFNSIPLFVLANLILLSGHFMFYIVSAEIMLIAGGLTWLFGRPAIHVGASGVIMGYWSYLVVNAYVQGTVFAIILGILTLYYFGAMFLSILPKSDGSSWEGHLFGLLAGIAASYLTPWLIQHGVY